MSPRIDLQILYPHSRVPPLEDFHAWIVAALSHPEVQWTHHDSPELTVRVVDEAESAELNQTWREKSGPTNILSFPAELPAEVPVPLLGDLVICAPLVAQEALEQNKPEPAHWAHLTIHGTLHLLGYDHVEPDQAARMEPLETAILDTLGWPDPYRFHLA